MSIVVVCPHCETRFTLQPEMAGKSMRCPNLECRQVFTVVPSPNRETAPEPTKPVKPKKKPSATVGEQVEILDAQLAPVPPRRDKARPPKPPAGDFEVVDAAVVSPPNVREVVWTGDDPLPPVRGTPPPPPVVRDDSDDDAPVLRRRKNKKKGNNGRVLILIGGLVGILVVVFFAARQIWVQEGLGEEKLAAQAKDEYGKPDYAAAGKNYEKLAAEYPDSPDNGKYKFLAEMSKTYSAVRAVTNRDDPAPALAKYREFVEANKGSPFAKPKTGFGHDVLQAGKQVGEDMAGYVEDRVKAFKADRAKPDELAKADAMIAATRELGPQLEPFRGVDDAPPFDKVYKQLDAAAADMKFERNRLAVFEKVRGLLAAPSDKVIEQATALLAENKLQDDGEAQAMVAAAKKDLQGLVKYELRPNTPQKPPESAAASLLFVAPIGVTKPAAKPPADDPGPSVFLAVARGVLYAIDEEGELLWAARVGTDVFDPPAVARVDLGEGPKELAVVASNVAEKPGITVIELRTGKALWFQPLPAPAAGPAVIHGTRAFVPVRDDLGSVFEFDLTNGHQVGCITLTQPIGPAALRPGTGLLYVPADARRVYVVDVGGKDDDGRRLHPRCVQVITTNHLAGTLRTPPIILGPAGDAAADRWMVLSQADGPTTMKLRAFPIAQALPADGATPTDVPAEASSELSVPGWAWFPPVTDGERLAIVTDAGQLRLFGVNQPGNADRAMFPLPHPTLPAPADGAPVPGFVVPAEEAAFWVLAGGSLQKVRLSLIPARGLEAVPASRVIALGVPTQAAQMNLRRDAACFVVRSAAGSGFRAVLVSLKDGETRWQRQLGLAPAAPPIPHGDGVLLIDEDGGASLVPPSVGGVAAGATKAAEPGWVVASSLDDVTGPTRVAVSADGKVVHTVTPAVVALKPTWVIRTIVGGKVERTGAVTSPAALAGPPVAFEKGLLLPAADGFVYRVIPGDGKSTNPDKLQTGLRWLEDRRNPDAVCFITVLSDDSFVTSDGGKLLTRWTWAGRDMTQGNAAWEVRERIAVPPLLLPAAGGGAFPRLLVADVTGSVWMYEMNKSGPPVRRWRSGGASPVPTGRPTSPLSLSTDASGRPVVSYVVENRSAVCFAPDKDVPLWVAKTGDDTGSSLVGHPRPIGDGRWLIADLSGKVRVLDGGTGQPAAAGDVALPGVVPSATGSQIDKTRMLIPLSDGSAVVVPVVEK